MATTEAREQDGPEPADDPLHAEAMATGSLYDQLGGGAGLRTAVAVFYARVVQDPLLAPWFAGIDLKRLKSHQHAFLSTAVGGPDVFTGRTMAAAHAGLAVTDPAFDAIVEHLAATLRDLDLEPGAVAEVVERVEALRADVVEHD
ncbi:group I truncated hemoglobin [Motilibacter deserti]|uniref:Group 1 truncated hemoglobin n=1 Tax=Motilibacter deserti TaxID=2714956 RepID=A0ABX0GTB1_9ACTN|nr:group 1 truncated hemoglobin [Motilibacter deserti]NHC12946.1 group 1 truncated hemoglobin [Motilibacter deserti]